MRRLLMVVAVVVVASMGAVSGQARPVTKLATAVAGGVKVRALLLEGSIKSDVDANTGQVRPRPDPLTMRLLLPNHYLRAVESWDGMLRQEGFSIGAPLHATTPLDTSVHVTGSFSELGPQYLVWQQGVAARMAIGLLGTFDGPLDLHVEAEANGSLHVTGPDDFDCHVDVDGATGLPLRVRYTGSVFFYTLPASGERRASQRTDKADLTLAFAERHSEDGVLLPHLITLTARSVTTGQSYTQEEIRIDRAQVNPPLTPADFKTR